MQRLTIATILLVTCGVVAPSLMAKQGVEPTVAVKHHPRRHAANSEQRRKVEEFIATLRSAEHDLALRLQDSPSPLDRALSTQLVSYEDNNAVRKTRGERLRKAAQDAPDNALIAWLWAKADPEDSGCDESSPCPERMLAPTKKDPDNLAAWLLALEASEPECDDEADVARNQIISHAAAASRYEIPMRESLAAWADVIDRYPEMVQVMHRLYPHWTMDDARSGAVYWETPGVEIGSFGPELEDACDGNAHAIAGAQRFADCHAIGRKLLDMAPTVEERFRALALLDPHLATADDRDKGLTLHWLRFAECRLDRSRHDKSGKRVKEAENEMADFVVDGDGMRVLRQKLSRAGIPLTPPAHWRPTWRGKPISPLDPREASGCPEPLVLIRVAPICSIAMPSVDTPAPDVQ